MGLLFALVILLVVVVVVGRAVRDRVVAARRQTHFVVARFDDVERLVRRHRCMCGRRPDLLGESTSTSTSGALEAAMQLECVCGRRERLTFTMGH
ncbi:MAG TPA: hypothetical protein VGF99_02900 [Myxococcota bacterium]